MNTDEIINEAASIAAAASLPETICWSDEHGHYLIIAAELNTVRTLIGSHIGRGTEKRPALFATMLPPRYFE